MQGQQLAVAYQPGRPNGWVIGSNLPQLEGGKVYELWFRRPGSSAMEPGGTFVPRDGAVVAPATLSDDVDLLAVTIEPAGGSLSPTSDPIFTSTVESSDRPTP